MANAKIWYYPSPSGTVEEIDLGEGLSDLQFETVVDQAVAEGISGTQATSQYSSRARLRVIDERFTSASLARKLLALREHLRRGGLCSIVEDANYAWAAFATVIPSRASTVTLPTFACPWPYGSPLLGNGAEIEVLGSQPLGIREYTTLSGTITGNGAQSPVTLSGGCVFDQREAGSRWVLLRHRAFWPLLRMPIGERNQPVITDDHRISYTLDVVLEEAIDQYETWAQYPDTQVQTTSVLGKKVTLERNPPEPIPFF